LIIFEDFHFIVDKSIFLYYNSIVICCEWPWNIKNGWEI